MTIELKIKSYSEKPRIIKWLESDKTKYHQYIWKLFESTQRIKKYCAYGMGNFIFLSLFLFFGSGLRDSLACSLLGGVVPIPEQRLWGHYTLPLFN